MVNSFVGLGLFVKWVCEKTRMRMKAEVGSNESKSFVLLLILYMVVTLCVREMREMRRIRELVYIGWLKMTVKMSSKFN